MSKTVSDSGLDFVIIRTRDAGIHFGDLVRVDDRTVVLHNARRLWSWEGCNTLNEVANHGPGEGSKISEPIEKIMLLEACEVIFVRNPEAIKNLKRSRWS